MAEQMTSRARCARPSKTSQVLAAAPERHLLPRPPLP